MTNARFLWAALASAMPLFCHAFDQRGVWSHEDERGSLSLQLNGDGSCEISALDRATGIDKRDLCTYWLHGSRLRLRAKHDRDGEGFSALDIEFLVDSNTLFVHGDKPRSLRKTIGPMRPG
jgi:hypothetical protein